MATTQTAIVNWTPTEAGLIANDWTRECPNCGGRMEGFVAMGRAHHADADQINESGERKGRHFHEVAECIHCDAVYEVVR